MTYFMQDTQDTSNTIATDKLIVAAAIVSLGCAGALTFSDLSQLSAFQETDVSQQIVVTTQVDTEIVATQFASFFGSTGTSGEAIDLTFIENVIVEQNALSNAALLQSFADQATVTPPTMNTQLSLSVSQALLRERGIQNPWLSAPLKNTMMSEITVDDFTLSLVNVPQPEIMNLLQKFGEMHTMHLTHYFDTTVLSKTEYHVAMAILHERGAI